VPPSLGSSSLSKSFLCSRPSPSTKSPGPPSTFPPTSPSCLARCRPRRHLPRPIANFSSHLCPHLPARHRLGSGHCLVLIWFASSCYSLLHTFQLRQHCPHSLPASAVIASCSHGVRHCLSLTPNSTLMPYSFLRVISPSLS